MTILLVDDNQVNLFVIEKILKNAGYDNCVSLTSAYELFDYLQLDAQNPTGNSVDLILLDIMMPEVDGIEACKRIKQDERLKDIQIIFVTALEDKNTLAKALDIGGVDYITKPINKTELLARIRVALRLKAELDWHTQQEKKIQYELDLATHVQRSLLSAPLNETNIQIEVSYLPSSNLAGDMYYWHKINDHRYAIILLDMMGHGIPAALVCMFISSVLREAVKQLEDPELVIKELNRYMTILRNGKDDNLFYFTAIYLVIDTEQKTIEYVNAGHPSGYALVDEKTLVHLNRGSCAVGFFDEIDVQKQFIQYNEDVQIILYTDGVLEAMGPCEMESEKQLQTLISTKWDHSLRLIDHLHPKEKQGNQADDMCVLIIQAR
ncbi:response regulator [Lysinibacillus sphaericus]|uniref:SpoIIE family protein phosphatase n=1 Tax=Lysinibacillus sphaericus TaxID=1421 RepID=UPI0018CF6965|nr:fused response regulator/phosphatase [Lysinibacillus sphaericus]MBG9454584.1 response regulator [Lysinibacillus sphaericus]MBG9476819.1 response regulator [Lysinibacillus sphaericus]MBG9592920.1 response regulator [Lysinibacillus sphaericus]